MSASSVHPYRAGLPVALAMAAGIVGEHRVAGLSQHAQMREGAGAAHVRAMQENHRRPVRAGDIPADEAHAIAGRKGHIARTSNPECARTWIGWPWRIRAVAC